MLMLVFRIYSATVAVTLLLEMLTTLRAQIHEIPLGDNELINTIILAALPLANLVIAFDDLIMLFRSKPQFILRYMFVRDRLDEITIIKDENKEDDNSESHRVFKIINCKSIKELNVSNNWFPFFDHAELISK